jgi:predicted alpha/beta-fold hydrolase
VTRSSEYTYTPAWWVPGAHLQTLWGKLVRRPPVVPTRAERWTTPDDDEIEIRRLDAPNDAEEGTPRLLVLHGLEGTIRSHYLRGVLDQARQRGWAADVLIFRGCNGEINRAPRLYHSGETTDLDFVVRRLVAENPTQPLVATGFSLGGNVLLKWLGEQGESVPEQFRAAAAVSVPYDLERGSRHIERGFSRVYTRHFLRTLREKALAKLARHPNLFDEGRLRDARTLFEFDEAVTAPVHGFESARDYYSRSSARHFLAGIRRPTLLLGALDDPFLPREVAHDVAILSESNELLTVEFHDRGGHVGFVSGRVPWRPHYHAEERVLEYLGQHLAISSFSTQHQLL